MRRRLALGVAALVAAGFAIRVARAGLGPVRIPERTGPWYIARRACG
jgi:hypothetical protein